MPIGMGTLHAVLSRHSPTFSSISPSDFVPIAISRCSILTFDRVGITIGVQPNCKSLDEMQLSCFCFLFNNLPT